MSNLRGRLGRLEQRRRPPADGGGQGSGTTERLLTRLDEVAASPAAFQQALDRLARSRPWGRCGHWEGTAMSLHAPPGAARTVPAGRLRARLPALASAGGGRRSRGTLPTLWPAPADHPPRVRPRLLRQRRPAPRVEGVRCGPVAFGGRYDRAGGWRRHNLSARRVNAQARDRGRMTCAREPGCGD